MMNEEFPTVEREKFNTGAGYYWRVNELLTECVRARMSMNKLALYNSLFSLYVELLAKCKPPEEATLVVMFHNITEHLNKRNNPIDIPDSELTNFELHMRKVLESKGMLTPKGDDPSSAISRGSY